MAPEHIDGTIKFKSDIYSLGVIIIEILTGQKRCPDIKQVIKNRVLFQSFSNTSTG